MNAFEHRWTITEQIKEIEMSKTEYKLPPRKWYTLEQAVNRVQQLTGEKLEMVDLIQYWKSQKIEICIYVELSPIYILISGKQPSEIKLSSYLIYSEDGNIPYKSDVCEIANLYQDEISDSIYFYGEKENKSNITSDYKFDFQFRDEKKTLSYYISEEGTGSYHYINGFFSLVYSDDIFFEYEFRLIKEGAIEFGNNSIMFSTPYKEGSSRIIIDLLNMGSLELGFDDLYILEQDLIRFLEDNANPPQPLKIKKKGRPHHSIKSLILAIGEETFKYNPQQSTNKLATAIYDYIEKFYFEEYGTVSQRAVNDYLKMAKIGKENARNRSKVIIYDPFKSE